MANNLVANLSDTQTIQRHFSIMQTESEHWWCTEYADDIHEILRKREYDRLRFDYRAPQINWRMHILQYIVDVGHTHNLARETVHLAAYLLDIFMDNHTIRLRLLYLVALTSIRIAAKIEESNFTSQKVNELNLFGNYFKDDYNALEMNMVKLFDWDFNVPTALTFGLYYAEFVVDVADFFSNFGICYANFKEFKEEMKHKVIGFVDVSLFDISLQHDIAPSRLAAMCLAAVRHDRNIKPVWPLRLIKLTKYTWECIEPDFDKLFEITLIPRKKLLTELNESIHQENQIDFD